jgi:hypothetical protein
MVTAGQLLAHAVGDYLLQSQWMADHKTQRWAAAWLHAVTYALPFLLLTRSPSALIVIAGTHAVIDHYRLARWVVWAKNWRPAASGWGIMWGARTATGYPETLPPWMAVWLMIIADNVMHVLINAGAICWL